VAVGGVHHDRVHPGLDQGFHALFGALAHAHRRTHAQSAGRVARGVGEVQLLGDVFHRDQALELKGVVHEQQAFELVLVQQGLGLGRRGAVGHGDQALTRRHDFADRKVVARFEAQVATGDDADHTARFHDREAGHAQVVGQLHDLTHRCLGRNHHRIAQHAGFIALDLGHLGRLLLRREVLVDDADAAFLGNGDGQPRFRHRVHGGRDQGQVQADVAGELGGEGGVLGQDLGVRGDEQNVVKCERFAEEAHEVKLQKHDCTRAQQVLAAAESAGSGRRPVSAKPSSWQKRHFVTCCPSGDGRSGDPGVNCPA
jgi:hypothetical protein